MLVIRAMLVPAALMQEAEAGFHQCPGGDRGGEHVAAVGRIHAGGEAVIHRAVAQQGAMALHMATMEEPMITFGLSGQDGVERPAGSFAGWTGRRRRRIPVVARRCRLICWSGPAAIARSSADAWPRKAARPVSGRITWICRVCGAMGHAGAPGRPLPRPGRGMNTDQPACRLPPVSSRPALDPASAAHCTNTPGLASPGAD